MNFDEIVTSWDQAHKKITSHWILQGKPEKMTLWGQQIPFKIAHDLLSQECNRELFKAGYLEVPEGSEFPEYFYHENPQVKELAKSLCQGSPTDEYRVNPLT